MHKVQVLLSTYNGERFLREQLDSLLRQEDVSIQITVRDDGSTDSTLEILNEYKVRGEIVFFSEANTGYQLSFLKLASYCLNTADYYAFCDQDDLWHPRKIITAINKLEKSKTKGCKLYFSNLIIVDEKLKEIGLKDYSQMKKTLGSAMVRFNISGCTMVFNNELLKIATRGICLRENISSHDAWFYKVCLSLGGDLIFDPNSYIYYRQHGGNVTGVRQGLLKRFSKELKGFTSQKNNRSQIAKVILNEYIDLIPEENLDLLREIANYKNSYSNTLGLLFNKKLKFGRLSVDALTKLSVVLRSY